MIPRTTCVSVKTLKIIWYNMIWSWDMYKIMTKSSWPHARTTCVLVRHTFGIIWYDHLIIWSWDMLYKMLNQDDVYRGFPKPPKHCHGNSGHQKSYHCKEQRSECPALNIIFSNSIVIVIMITISTTMMTTMMMMSAQTKDLSSRCAFWHS